MNAYLGPFCLRISVFERLILGPWSSKVFLFLSSFDDDIGAELQRRGRSVEYLFLKSWLGVALDLALVHRHEALLKKKDSQIL